MTTRHKPVAYSSKLGDHGRRTHGAKSDETGSQEPRTAERAVSVAEPFEPPKYIASLIASINDGAKMAQTGALAFSAVGLYLLATALSATDEDLLLQRTTSIAQLGVQVPVMFSFVIAPLVFVALHVFTLIRYDMLSTNLRQFRHELESQVPWEVDRERCRQLLTNVEFVVSRAVPRGSPLQSRIFRLIAFGLIALFPVAVLIVLEVRALRYQSLGVTWTQRGALTIDLAVLGWFFYRQRVAGGGKPNSTIAQLRFWVGRLWAPAALLAMNFAWLNIAGPGEVTVKEGLQSLPGIWPWGAIIFQPVDLLLCQRDFQWGCRFLTVDHRTLVDRVWKQEAIATLRAREGNTKTALASIEGAFLRGRTLRFATLDESRLYGADLIGADLSNASLRLADLTGAHLNGASLNGADLANADLTGADLGCVNDRPPFHSCADLTGVNLNGANLNGANLGNTDLTGVNLHGADLSSADLTGVLLDGQAQLDQACGTDAKLPPGSGFTLKPCQK